MTTLTTEPQFIFKNGLPEFAIITYDDFSKAFCPSRDLDAPTTPHDVVGLAIRNEWNLLKAWRLFLKLTQSDMAQRMGITQAAYSKAEKGRPGRGFLSRAAKALGITVEQLDLDQA